MSRLLQQLVNGTVLGATIGLIALGYTMVYGIIQLINFAHGEIFMIGSYAGLAAYTYLLPDSVTSHAWITLQNCSRGMGCCARSQGRGSRGEAAGASPSCSSLCVEGCTAFDAANK